MTRIWNPYVFTPLGNPIVGEAPPVLRVMGGMQATAQQLSYAQQRFTQFVMQARLSTVPNPTEAGRLPDGTQYRIVKVGPQTTMEIWPGGATEPIDSKSAIYVEVMLPGAPYPVRYLLRPKGTVADPGRPWRVDTLEPSKIYLYVDHAPPGDPFWRAARQGVDVAWHSLTGKNYLVSPAVRAGQPMATLYADGGWNALREFTYGGERYFGQLRVESYEVRFAVFPAAPFIQQEAPSSPPLLTPIRDDVIYANASTSSLHESKLAASEHPSGGRLFMLMERSDNPRVTPPIPYYGPEYDEFGLYEQTGCLVRDASLHALSGRPQVTLVHRSVGDSRYRRELDEYRRQGFTWSKTSQSAGVLGSCSPSKYRTNQGLPFTPVVRNTVVVDELTYAPAVLGTSGSTSDASWLRARLTNGKHTVKVSSSATFDENTEQFFFVRNGSTAVVKSWGGEEYEYSHEAIVTHDAYLRNTTSGTTHDYNHIDANYKSFERRRSTEGFALGNRRLVTLKTDVSVTSNSTLEHRGTTYNSHLQHHFLYTQGTTTRNGTRVISVDFEGRTVQAYDPFLDLLCYTECRFSYTANFSGRFVITSTPPADAVEETSGSAGYLPISSPPDIDLVIECAGRVVRHKIPPPTAEEDPAPDRLFRQLVQQVPILGVGNIFTAPLDPAMSESDYIAAVQRSVASPRMHHVSAPGSTENFAGAANSSVYPDDAPFPNLGYQNMAVFGAMVNVSNAASVLYAADPRTGGAVLVARWRGKNKVAYAIDKNGMRPLDAVIPELNPEHIYAVGSA